MATIIEGKCTVPPKKVACIVSRFNEEITGKLLEGALNVFKETGIPESQIDVFRVPGAFEIPIILKKILSTQNYSGVTVLSAVVKGETQHDLYVSNAITEGTSRLSLEFGVPVSFGVITAKNWRQAEDRSGGKHGNRGTDAARVCLGMIDVMSKVSK